MPSDFEEFMEPRLERYKSDEATKIIYELWDGRKLEDAVLDVIESLPAGKTRRLRAWVQQFGDYLEWKGFERAGWEIEKKWRGAFPRPDDRFVVIAPDQDQKHRPHEPMLAAAVGAGEVVFVGGRPGQWPEFIYAVRRGMS
jgi:hypothetical protein